MEQELIAMFAGYGTGSISVRGRRITVWLHDKRDSEICSFGDASTIAEAFAIAKRQIDHRTKDRGDLDQPCSHCGAQTKADVEFLCTASCRAHVERGEPCHGETP
jgi:hypothetical protein